MESNETHNKIINVLNEKGPSLPIQIANVLGMSSLFISAFLSELADSKRIKITNLKVGGSPLYFLEGQEEKLEPYHKYMHPKEAETFLYLREKKVLRDSDQEPAVRVALRSIKDFAVGFKIAEQIYWRYILVPETDVEELINNKKKQVKIQSKKEADKKVEEHNNELVKSQVEKPVANQVNTSSKKENASSEFKNPLVISSKKKERKKSDFVIRVIDFIKGNGLQIVEEGDYKAKEYNCVVKVKSELGFIDFLTQAKDKKTITESDLKKLLSNAQSIPIPALMFYTGNIGKKSKEFLSKYSSILKAKKIE